MTKPTLHVVALPHTRTTDDFLSCAYTQKVVKFTRMMRGRGYPVILYGSEVNDAECDEHVVIVEEARRQEWFGERFDTVLTPLSWEPTESYWLHANSAAILAIADRCDPHDLLCLIGGWAQHPIADALKFLTVAEWGVGYEGVLPRSHRAFESSAWRHWVYGKANQSLGRWYDTVIPNFFDRRDFRPGDGSGGYLLYLGRLVERKGVHVAVQIAETLGMPLLIAGPGATDSGPGYVTAPELELRSDHLEYVGEADRDTRRDLLANAACLLAPTLYIEPFGGVAVEAMLSGTPAVTSDYGAFPETVETGRTGYRFSTLAEGCTAVEEALKLNRRTVRRRALERFSLEAVAPMYDHWLDQLNGLWEGGWDNVRDRQPAAV